jgi:hypothetical protein
MVGGQVVYSWFKSILLKDGKQVVSSWLALAGRKGYSAQGWQAGCIFMVSGGRQEEGACTRE